MKRYAAYIDTIKAPEGLSEELRALRPAKRPVPY